MSWVYVPVLSWVNVGMGMVEAGAAMKDEVDKSCGVWMHVLHSLQVLGQVPGGAVCIGRHCQSRWGGRHIHGWGRRGRG